MDFVFELLFEFLFEVLGEAVIGGLIAGIKSRKVSPLVRALLAAVCVLGFMALLGFFIYLAVLFASPAGYVVCICIDVLLSAIAIYGVYKNTKGAEK